MTNLETEIYKREEDNVIGARVIVSADSGQTIDEIRVVNKTQFDELVAKLDTLGEDYVQFEEDSTLAGRTLDSILSNTLENANINATLLNGYQSSYYAKATHNHNKSNITNLYDYELTLSKYTMDIGESITVTARVTDSTGAPVVQNITIEKNNVSWVSGRTNNNGEFSSTFKATGEGLVTFSVNNQKLQVLVNPAPESWETVYSTTYYTLQHKGEFCRLIVDSGNNLTSYATTWKTNKTLDGGATPYLPNKGIIGLNNSDDVYFLDPNGAFWRKTYGTPGNRKLYVMLEWTI